MSEPASAGPPVDPAADANVYAGLLSPADKIVIAYLTLIAALVFISRERVSYWWLFIAAHLFVIALIAVAASRRRGVAFIRGWYPVALIPFTFKELTYLVPLLHPRDYDPELAAIDYGMFGVHPTVWLERLTHPLLTELLQLAYTTYYFMPLALGAVLWRKRWYERFHFLLFVIVTGFYVSYLGYIAVPAIGPRFVLADQQTQPLAGVLLFDWVHATLNRLEGVMRDCFPSGHTMLTLLVLYYAQRFHHRTFWWMLPSGIALIIATVYLRYHYVIDVIAGALLALAIVLAARPLYRLLDARPDGSRIQI